MRFPPGVDADKAIFGYMQALQGFPIEAIAYGIRKFLRGECEGVNPKYCPHPPELATIVRGVIPERKTMPTGKLFGYSSPHSKIVARKCTKDYGAQLVRNGAIPHGSIWCPGPINDHPEIGDVYGPDPNWRGAKPLFDKSAE